MASGAEIKQAREALDLTQRALAKAIGVTQPTIKRIESGQVRRSKYHDDVERYLGLAPPQPSLSAAGAALIELRRIEADLRSLVVQLGLVLERLSKPE